MFPLRILLIENDPATAGKIRAALADAESGPFELERVKLLSEALGRLSKKETAAVLLDLSLPDSHGIATFEKLFEAAPDVPILILGGDAAAAQAKYAVGRGAQDYLLPNHLDSYSLPRALRNAIDRKAVEDALYVEKERALVTLNSIGDGVLCTNISGNVTYLNLVAEKLLGWTREDATGRPLSEVFRILDAATRQPAKDPLEMAVEQNRVVGLTVNCVLIRRDGSEFAIEDSAAPIHDRAGRVIGAVIVFHDVSEARAMSIQMSFSAQHDIVTNLPNRLLLNDRISQSIALARRQSRPIAMLFLDLDHFKEVNDSLGHAAGDKLLQSVSKCLIGCVRGSDTVSRQGGDEFAILLTEISHADDAAICAQKILLALNEEHCIQDRGLRINGSIGISIYPQDGEDAETLIKNADMAMYHAKERGRSNFQFFAPEMNMKAVARRTLETGLQRALKQGEFVLHYQPRVNLATAEITGVEALIRWQQPEQGLVCPNEFVPIAEECGLIVQIGRWALREACTQARGWHQAGLPVVPLAVNVSAVEFRNKAFVAGVRDVLAETGLEPQNLELELTEGVLMDDAKSTVRVLDDLKKMGICLAVDDFGTGYSSLSYLRQFPIDVLKIDRSFVHQIAASHDDSLIIGAIVSMGRSLKHLVVAEGIETQEQRAYLQAQQCAEGQGYLFSRPLDAAQFAQLLRSGVGAAVTN